MSWPAIYHIQPRYSPLPAAGVTRRARGTYYAWDSEEAMKTRRAKWMIVALSAMVASGLAACDDKPSGKLAPISSSLAPAKPHSKVAEKFEVQEKTSHVDFLMAAPIERIHGKAPGAVSGQLYLDLQDITRSNGFIKVDLDKLVLYHSRRKNKQDKFGDEDKNAHQNEHMKTWLQISDDAPKAIRERYRYVQFKVNKVDSASRKNILAMKGAERKTTVSVTGDFLLHGRKVTKKAKLDLEFRFSGDKPASVHVKSDAPVLVSLEAHDVKPRETFEKLAAKTLGALGQKVAPNAPVSFDFDAEPAK